jgi:hypothetical protein
MPEPSAVLVESDTVGLILVDHTTPLDVTDAPPSEITLPPKTAEFADIALIEMVEIVGIVDIVGQETTGQFSNAAFFQRTLISSKYKSLL